ALRTGDTVGPYRLIRELGRGGMGVVYEAEQNDPRRVVALKILPLHNSSDELRRRFDYEARALAQLDHPGIARILEAGTSDDGLRYFAMQLVEGTRIDEFARQGRLNLRRRVDLLRRVCQAVAHAHQRGVIHRDLKPANVLVKPDGEPVVLDFGIARILEDGVRDHSMLTREGQVLGTLAYMSPEQLLGETSAVDTRSDVYALGILAFEVLAGKLPIDVSSESWMRAARRIETEVPPRLRKLCPEAPRDLEIVIAKALAKLPEERYSSAFDLGEELQRVLDEEAILARAPSLGYRATKMLRRHPVLSSLGFATATTLAIGFAWAMAERGRAQRAANAAEARSKSLARAHRFVGRLIEAASPRISGAREVSIREAVAGARTILQEEVGDDYQVAGPVHLFLAATYESLARVDDVDTELRSLDACVERGYAPALAEQVQAELLHARVLTSRRQSRAALDRVAEAESLARASSEAHDPDVQLLLARAASFAARLLATQRDFAAAEAKARDAVNIASAVRGAEADLGFCCMQLGDWPSARAHYRAALDVRRTLYPEGHPELGYVLDNFASLLRDHDDFEEAEPLYKEALTIFRNRHPGEDHRDVAVCTYEYGHMLRRAGRLAEARPLLEEALAMRRRLFQGDSAELAASLEAMAELLLFERKRPEARVHASEALAMRTRLHGEAHITLARPLMTLTQVDIADNQLAKAESAMRRAIAIHEEHYGPKSPLPKINARLMGTILARQGRFDEASALLTELAESLSALLGEAAPARLAMLSDLAKVYRLAGKPSDEARTLETIDAVKGRR
ncbi:MAG TPA: serine/threonine-protein kinase, partial [Planctomycetota bacterium]|nr:serine/threonine-protein kinase [Planctomycetota bacterium]